MLKQTLYGQRLLREYIIRIITTSFTAVTSGNLSIRLHAALGFRFRGAYLVYGDRGIILHAPTYMVQCVTRRRVVITLRAETDFDRVRPKKYAANYIR